MIRTGKENLREKRTKEAMRGMFETIRITAQLIQSGVSTGKRA